MGQIENCGLYAKVNGIALAIIGILGFLIAGLGPILQFDTAHNVIHLVIAVVALYIGFANVGPGVLVGFAKIFGVVYLLLGIVGWFAPSLFGILGTGFNLEWGENLIHLVLGSWGAWIGFKG